MLFLLLSSLALESELSERVPRKRKPLGHSAFYPFIMHPVSYFHCAIPYLALRSLSLNLQMQAAEAGWRKTTQIQTLMFTWASKPDLIVFPGKKFDYSTRVSYWTWDKTELKKGSDLDVFMCERETERNLDINLISTSCEVLFLFLACKIRPFEESFGVLEAEIYLIFSLLNSMHSTMKRSYW